MRIGPEKSKQKVYCGSIRPVYCSKKQYLQVKELKYLSGTKVHPLQHESISTSSPRLHPRTPDPANPSKPQETRTRRLKFQPAPFVREPTEPPTLLHQTSSPPQNLRSNDHTRASHSKPPRPHPDFGRKIILRSRRALPNINNPRLPSLNISARADR